MLLYFTRRQKYTISRKSVFAELNIEFKCPGEIYESIPTGSMSVSWDSIAWSVLEYTYHHHPLSFGRLIEQKNNLTR